MAGALRHVCALEVGEEPCEVQGAALHASCRRIGQEQADVPKVKDQLLCLVSPPKEEARAWQEASWVLEAAPSILRHIIQPHVLGDSDGGQL